MKNMYAVKCLYQSTFYSESGQPLEDITPSWEERVFLLKANSLEDADSKCEKAAKTYEMEYTNSSNQTVRVKLYEILDIFAIFDTGARTNIEVYSKIFSATRDDVEKMLDIEYPKED